MALDFSNKNDLYSVLGLDCNDFGEFIYSIYSEINFKNDAYVDIVISLEYLKDMIYAELKTRGLQYRYGGSLQKAFDRLYRLHGMESDLHPKNIGKLPIVNIEDTDFAIIPVIKTRERLDEAVSTIILEIQHILSFRDV